MPNPIKIFICHKKLVLKSASATETEEVENVKATFLNSIFEIQKDRYSPWIDNERLGAGMIWESTIYQNLLESDVLLVAIGPGTSKSEWVRREIALAKAFKITILPVGYDLTQAQFAEELKAVDLAAVQGRLLGSMQIADTLRLLEEPLRMARDTTAREQAQILDGLNARRRVVVPKARNQKSAFSVQVMLGGKSMRVHVTSGDLLEATGIDALVNSENDYMQMARVFESRTVSSMLRQRGAAVGGRYVDIVQRELDAKLGERSRPVTPGEAFATSAGAPDSALWIDNKVRCIIHVAAVRVSLDDLRVEPIRQESKIRDFVYACLRALREVNVAAGVVSPVGTPQRAAQEQRARDGKGQCRSVLFPLFGTGQGGAKAEEAIAPMLTGITGFFANSDHFEFAKDIDDIYIAAYTEPDVIAVSDALRAHFN